MNLPDDVARAVKPVFEELPLQSAMRALIVKDRSMDRSLKLVEQVVRDPAIAGNPSLQAGLWLYVDALDESHTVSQAMKNQTGSYWHGIMHRREGDFSNSHYWFTQTGHHPAMDEIPDYDAHSFIDEVAKRHKESPEELITRQRQEWQALFSWCANNGG